MEIGIIGTGNIGSTLAKRLPTKGHEVKIANSRGPETIDEELLSTGARAVTAEEAAHDVDALVMSIPFSATPDLAPIIAKVSEGTVLIDTSNYIPGRDGANQALENGQAESEWVVEHLGGRTIAKAWNAILAGVFADDPREPGDPERIAIPVAADDARTGEIARSLVEDTGFDAVDSGPLTESWRQQPGSPAYCTSLTASELRDALARGQKDRVPHRRDLLISVLTDRMQEENFSFNEPFIKDLGRLIYG